MKAAKLTGSASAIGMPSTSTAARPSSSQRASRSGFSVCSSCGKGESGFSESASSSAPSETRASGSMLSSRRASALTVSGFAAPSRKSSATRVCERRPSVRSASLSCGVARCRRTSAVLARRVSTKLSRLPLRDFSSVGSPTARADAPRRSKLIARPSASHTSAQRPCVRSSQSSFSVFLSSSEGALTAPSSSAAKTPSASAPPRRRGSHSGRSSSSAVSKEEISPSIQQINSSVSAPTDSRRA